MKTEVKCLGNTKGELFTSWHYVASRLVAMCAAGARNSHKIRETSHLHILHPPVSDWSKHHNIHNKQRTGRK